jgi:hypothetical protein
VKIRRTEEKELGFGGRAETRKGVGDASHRDQSKELISEAL